ncbi:MAG: CHAD domain-containing protein [Holophagaceae bacterium]|uniref:CHAD domain-containing protein n=1 Tax=Candidatus Geothrix skivensis TaxID=2954439 RepID=A0A9D7XMJ7_9BACT|nr:CHAD domain-containing protein [Candidatus Geothrix skivensis]
MHPAELAILLHHALEVRLARLQELIGRDGWTDEHELLHQVRVAARRLGAVLDLVDADNYPGHKAQRRALKALVDLLGLTRELDVHAGHLQAYHRDAATSTQAAVLECLLEQVDRGRAKARRAMARELDHLRLPDLGRLLEVPSLQHPFQAISLQGAAWACLEPRLHQALGHLAELAAHEDPAALHRTRVKIKKLRYALEALEGAFAEPPEAVLSGMRALQTTLGEHHDLAALEALLWESEAQLRARDRPTLCAGLLDLLGAVAESRRSAFDRFVAQVPGQDPTALTSALRRALGLPPANGALA